MEIPEPRLFIAAGILLTVTSFLLRPVGLFYNVMTGET
jgi:hypothetical protein